MKPLLPPITKKQKEILLFIYRYRFLTRSHLQAFLAHTSPSLINHWLANLVEKQYLFSIERQTNTEPAIYYLGNNGIRYLKQLEKTTPQQAQNLYSEKNRSSMFRTHCLSLASFACNLITHMRKQKKQATFLTKTDFMQETDDELCLLLQRLKPDAYYTYNGTGIAREAFIEIIDDYIPARVLANKIKQYIQLASESDLDIFDGKSLPSLIFLFYSDKKLRSLQQIIKRVKNTVDDDMDEAIRCNLALVSDIQTKSIADDIWIGS